MSMSQFFKKNHVRWGLFVMIPAPIYYAVMVLAIFKTMGREAADLFVSSTSINLGASKIAGQDFPAIPGLNIGLIVMLLGVLTLVWPKVQEWRKSKSVVVVQK